MELKKAVLSFKETYAQAMAVTAPLGSVVSTTTAAILYAGSSVIFTTFLSLLTSALWIYTLSMYTKKLASAGGYYNFNYGAWRSKKLAFLEALTEMVAYTLLNVVNVIAVYTILSAVSDILGIIIPNWVIYSIIGFSVAYPSLISFTHVKKLLGYVVTISATAEAALLISLFFLSLSKGIHFDYFVPKFRNFGDLATAYVLTTVSISGAGAATYLGEETKNPHENVSKGMWLALIIGGISMFLGTYAMIVLWPSTINSLANSNQPLFVEMIQYGVIAFYIALMLSINSLLASNIGTTIGAARILFNLAREKAAPKIFTKVNRSGEPLVATAIIGISTAIIAVLSVSVLGITRAFTEVAAVEGVLWLLGRILDGFGAPVFYWRINSLGIANIVIPITATAVNSWGDIQSVLQMDIVQLLMITVFAGIVVSWYILKARKGFPGTLVVDENNNVITIDEYLKKIKAVNVR
ncbi:MAG: APC family permease [Saccharolobus sp.]|uniref:Amino acid permease related protein n=1 Tax=Saccharolobus shibatae (strain ATCC 51178 / DSM 5389 / JCM 8931 / NBRC 15437 / B12) TaxID=523848 RepID=A0A8F5BLN0_SACSH|nr:APC family permease [Saccharolobus shibatae]MCH4814647.1 APC family permease [Saccharolobus shibatae]QXJ27445.1 Amino acid permease related protein [Saccharolobus shibatae B12]